MTPALPINDSDQSSTLAANQKALHQRVLQAAQAAGRDPSTIELIAVTKSVQPQIAMALHELGETNLAENRLESFDKKLVAFDGVQPTWHFIGHVQRNKARRVIERSDVIHSIDSVKLLNHCARIAAELGRKPGIYLQVKIADEAAKYGLTPGEVPAAIEAALAASDSLELRGLMVMAPLCTGASTSERRAAASQTFQAAADLARGWPELELGLSMGMTGDFEEAIAKGATAIRVGSAFFQGIDSPSTYV